MKDRKWLWVIGIIVAIALLSSGQKQFSFGSGSTLSSCQSTTTYECDNGYFCVTPCVLITASVKQCLDGCKQDDYFEEGKYFRLSDNDEYCSHLYSQISTAKCYIDCAYGGLPTSACAPSTDSHLICKDNACVRIPGAGADECTPEGTICNQEHLACVNDMCMYVAGAGADECTPEDSDCGTHTECVDFTCYLVQGSGVDECSGVGSTCDGSCTVSTWAPSPATVCDGKSFTQTSDCDTTRGATGTKDCADDDGTPFDFNKYLPYIIGFFAVIIGLKVVGKKKK